MFFYLSKIFSIFFFPLPLFLLILIIYFIYKKEKIFLLLILIFYIISTEYFASRFLQILENQFQPIEIQLAEPIDAVIVLGGLSNPLRMVTNLPEFTDGVDRILIAEKLLQLKKTKYIILSGATGYIRQNILPESITLKKYLKLTIPEQYILIDDKSRNTYENAIESLKICKQHGFKKVYLITSAFHMYRAYSVFQKVLKKYYSEKEIIIIPYPVDYRSLRQIAGIEDFFPTDSGLQKSTIAIKEFIGIVAYKLKGYL
ncbi:MAG: hypothetical protein KatS3mg129_1051 [Leptospiraceae bacterium]|nr:MAG: hypothetical protein KatS3mg129_1051 [Leptospiraceae bacterium]